MKIGINLIQYTDIQGIEIFAKNLLSNLVHQNPNHKFVFFVNQKSANIFNIKSNNVKIIIKNFKNLSKFKLIFYQQLGLIKALNKEKINILYCPSTAAPLFYYNKIITILDCAIQHFPEESTWFSKIYLNLAFLSAKIWSKSIITISNFSKKEITKLLKIKPKKINVILGSVPTLPIIDNKIISEIIQKFNLTNKKYFLYIGNLSIRKNLPRILEAFAIFIKEFPNYFLVIIGKIDQTKIEPIINKLNINSHIILTSFISEKIKTALYKKSTALIFPTLYEGFGLPVLEAQSLGIPVLTSNNSSLPETAGYGALLVNPYNARSIYNGLKIISQQPSLRKKLVKEGYANLSRFSWTKAANHLTRVIEKYNPKQL